MDNHQARDCNCSICQKKGFLPLHVQPEQFSLLSGAEVLTTYTFNIHIAKHTFCSICGIHPFCRSRSHPDAIDVNVCCLNREVLSRFHITTFDGVNWEENVHKIRNESVANQNRE